MKKRRQRHDETAAILDPELTTRSAPEQPKPITEDEELEDVFSDFPQNDNCIELWRTTAQGGRPEFLEQMTPSAFSFAYVTDTYGGGRYVAKGKYKNGDVEKRSFNVAGDPFPVKRKQERTIEPDQPRTSAQPLQAAVPALPEGAGLNEILGALMGMMQKMMVESRTSEVEMLTKMKMYKELFSEGGGRSQTPVHELIGMVKTGIELAQTSGAAAGDAGGFPWLMVLDKVKEPLTKLADSVYVAVSNYKGGAQPVMPNVPVQAVPTAQPAQTSQPEPPEENMEIVFMGALRAMVPMLVTGAAQRTEPGFYADLLLDQIPRQYYATAKTWLEKPDCLEQLTKINAAVAHHREWFQQLQVELLEAVNLELGHAPQSVQSQQASDPSTLGTADLSNIP